MDAPDLQHLCLGAHAAQSTDTTGSEAIQRFFLIEGSTDGKAIGTNTLTVIAGHFLISASSVRTSLLHDFTSK